MPLQERLAGANIINIANADKVRCYNILIYFSAFFCGFRGQFRFSLLHTLNQALFAQVQNNGCIVLGAVTGRLDPGHDVIRQLLWRLLMPLFQHRNQCIFSKRLNPVTGQYDNIIRLQPTGFIAQIDQLHYFSRYILRVEFASRVDEPTPR